MGFRKNLNPSPDVGGLGLDSNVFETPHQTLETFETFKLFEILEIDFKGFKGFEGF